MRGARVTELMHGELEVELGAVDGGKIREGVGLENAAVIGEPESGAGTWALHVMTTFLEVAF